MKPPANPLDTTTFVLRKKYGVKLSRLHAIRILCRHGLGVLGAIRAIRRMTKRGHAMVTMPLSQIIVNLFVLDLERAGVWSRRHDRPLRLRPFYPVPFEDWKIGMQFWCGPTGFPWRVTDVGTRTITAIHLNRPHDESWYTGPPYAVQESVFDENDLQVCYLEKPEEWMND